MSHMENSISAGMMQQHVQQQQQGSHTAPVNIPGSPMNSAMAGLFQGTSAPVNIPGSSLGNFSPTTNHLFGGVGDPFAPPGHPQHPGQQQQQQQQQAQHHGHHMSGSAPKIGNGSFAHGDSLFFQSQLISPNLGDTLSSISPDLRMTTSSIRDELHSNGVGSLFDNGLAFSKSPCINPGGLSDLDRLKDELMNKSAQMLHMEEQQRKVYEKWKSEIDDNSRKVRGGAACLEFFNKNSFIPQTAIAEQQRDDALNHAQVLKDKLEMYSVQNGPNLINGQELRSLSLPKLKSLQVRVQELLLHE